MISYAESDRTLVLRFSGDVRYTSCNPLNQYLNQVFEQDRFDNILLDLTGASCLDSTALGLLAKISNFIEQHYRHKTTIFSSNEDINRTLDSVGFSDIFLILDEPPLTIPDTRQLPDGETIDDETAAMVLSAHRTLAGISEANWRQFKDVVNALESELGNARGKSGNTFH